MTTSARRSAPATARPAGLDLQSALRQLEEAGAGSDDAVLDVVERAVAGAYSRMVPEAPPVTARLDPMDGTLELTRQDDTGAQVLVTDLPADFARQAAHAAKIAISSWLRDAERERLIREATARRGELADAIVERPDGQLWWLRIDGAAALLPPEEQIAQETLERGRHLKILVLEARRRAGDAVIVVSRSHPNLLRRLLEQEVPEMSTGQVTVRALAREPGRRSKVAVDSPGGNVDPEGACIGPRGVRIRAVVAELGEEAVHIVAWSSDPATFVANSLAPAEVLGVDLDEATRTAKVLVPQSQLSLAIGRSGENARLAARLTGWRIDIHGDEAGPPGQGADGEEGR